jgi:flavin-dependent dehydrogenase
MRRADVIVIGAGPAGSAAATVLAEAGRSVLLIGRPTGARRPLAESIPPSAHRLLTELGMDSAVDAAGFHPWLGNTVWWAEAPARTEEFASEATGLQVERDRFDAVLRDVAVAAGAQWVRGRVRDVLVPTVTVDLGDDTMEATAPWILDCSGRSGVLARHGLRVHEPSHRTVALAGIWRAESPWPHAQTGHTLVASHADGWAWSVPVSSNRRYITVMVDPERSRLAHGVSALDVYRAELAKVQPFAPLIAAARLEDGPWGADASLYGATQHAGPGFLLVGDAATFIDPLSSFGVKKALASGWLAGVVVHTLLTTPAMQETALAFFETRERAIAASFRRQAAQYANAAGTDHPFWQARATPTSIDTGEDEVNPAALAQDPDVLVALRELQSRPVTNLVLTREARIEPRPVIRGRSLVMEEHLVVPAWPSGLRYIRNIDVVLVTRLAAEHQDIGEMYEALVRIQPAASLPDVLGVLATLVARGALHHLETVI